MADYELNMAWMAMTYWTDQHYQDYRKYVAKEAPKLRGNTDMDCADLSMVLVINFASQNSLPLEFRDNDGVVYSSAAVEQDPPAMIRSKTWRNVKEFTAAVTSRLGTEALWKSNTEVNPDGPQAGDLMIDFDGRIHHSALVFAVYLRGIPHPMSKMQHIQDFPADTPLQDGDEIAIHQPYTEYFRDRDPNSDQHIDYLNHRSNRKAAGAELIYFAKVGQIRKAGFEFRKWSKDVMIDAAGWNKLTQNQD